MELSNEELYDCFLNYHRALYDEFYRDPGQMVLTVKSSKGKNLKILVDSSFTIYYVKLNIEYAYGRHIYPMEQQKVRHRGIVLEDEIMLLGTTIFEDGYIVLDMKSEEVGSKKLEEGEATTDPTKEIQKSVVKEENQNGVNLVVTAGGASFEIDESDRHEFAEHVAMQHTNLISEVIGTEVDDLKEEVAIITESQRSESEGVEEEIWDACRCKRVRAIRGHRLWVGPLARSSIFLSSGSRDSTIFQRDIRAQEYFVSKLPGHKSEVCELNSSYDDRELASGGNDNRLFVGNQNSTQPVLKYGEHSTTVKAIAWCPHVVIYIPFSFSLLIVGVLGSGSFLLQWFPWCRRVASCVVDARKLYKKILQRGVGSWKAIVLMYIQGRAPKLFANRPLKGVFAPFDRGRKRILVDCSLGVLFFEESVLLYLWAPTAQAVCTCIYKDVTKFTSGYMASLSAMTQLELFYISFQILLACEISQMSANLSSNLELLVESVENCKGKVFHDEIGTLYCVALENLKSLEGRDISNNIISNFSEIDFLVCLPFLRSLWLEGNPLCRARCYRAQVFNYFIHLDKVKLDDKHISNKEYWKWQIIIASRQKRPATFDFYSPTKDVAKEEGGNIKPRGESVKLKKEDSLSSMESDSRSSNFVFMQGVFNATSYAKQMGRSMVYQQYFTFVPPEELGTTSDRIRKKHGKFIEFAAVMENSVELIWKLLNNCTHTLNLEDKVFLRGGDCYGPEVKRCSRGERNKHGVLGH